MRLRVTIDGKAYEVDIEVAEPEPTTTVRYVGGGRSSAPVAPLAAPSGGGGRNPADEGRACRSPLAGVVSEVNVAPGDVVTADQAVLVLEAMKMFTTITSPVDGTVVAVDVAVGDAVKQGQLLVEFE